MLHLRHIDALPRNFDAFVAQMAHGIAELYGPEAGQQYARSARGIFQTTLAHDFVQALAVFDGKDAAGLLLGMVRDDAAQVAVIHVLERYTSTSVAERLLKECVRGFRAGGVEVIVAEFIPFCALHLDATYEALGFERFERLLMGVALNVAGLTPVASSPSTPCDKTDWPGAAAVVVAAYETSPGRRLHTHVRDLENAIAFLRRAAAGTYGKARPEFTRVVKRNGECVGVAVGCQVAPDVGFVLQIAVHPLFQNQGIGTQLVRDLADIFRQAGFSRISLGVTALNPARRLYERLGFSVLRPVNAYAWWRP